MNKYELVYDLKEHLDTYSQTYDDYIMSYGETDMIYHYIEEKDKEIERLNNIINELEKDFERKIQSCTVEAEATTNDFYCRLHIATLKRWLNKIKELKGSDNK